MNLKLIHRVIDSYNETLDESDKARLAFFEGLWEEMDRWSSGATAAAKGYGLPSQEAVLDAWNSDQAILRIAPAQLNKDRFVAIFKALCTYVASANVMDEQAVQELLAFDIASSISEDLLTEAGKDPEAFLNDLSQEIDQSHLSAGAQRLVVLIAMLALRVDFEGIASALSEKFPKGDDNHHNPLCCPVCGSKPALARVGGADSPTDGRGRSLYCQQCGCVWDFERIRCARCGTRNQGHLHYFNVEGDDGHRIATCDECGGYIRSVFIEEALRPFSFEVEEVVTARLDAIAHDPRFQASNPQK